MSRLGARIDRIEGYWPEPTCRFGPITTGSSRQPVRRCPLCPESRSKFGATRRPVTRTISCLYLTWGARRNHRGGSIMKALLASATLAILVATPAMSAEQVSLVGTWTGQRDRIAKVEGRRGGLATLVITEQQGNTFTGRLKRSNPTGDEEEPLWGAFTPGAKLMMGSDDEGYYIFSLINRNALDYCYSESAPSPRTVCARLTRQR